jgi:menaquinone-dependent protoporphyrinogen IX oxidase
MPIYVDETLPKPPKDKEKLTFRERYARLSNYIQPILNAASPAKPVSIGIFGGRLEYGRLQWWAVLFAMVIIQARAGDRRNWSAIRAWAGDLAEKL